MLNQRQRLPHHFIQLNQEVNLPQLEDQQDLNEWIGDIQQQLQQFKKMFYDGIDTLAKIKLGLFSTKTDKSDLEKARELVRTGYDFCVRMQDRIHDALIGLTIESYKLIKKALEQKKPMQIQFEEVLKNLVMVLSISGIILYIVTSVPFFVLIVAVPVVAIIGAFIYEGIKLSNHRKIIKTFLKMEPQINLLLQLQIRQN